MDSGEAHKRLVEAQSLPASKTLDLDAHDVIVIAVVLDDAIKRLGVVDDSDEIAEDVRRLRRIREELEPMIEWIRREVA